MNPYLLSYIKNFDIDTAICVFTNGGNLDYGQYGTVDLLPLRVFYHPYSIDSILALVDATSQFRVTIDTNNKTSMLVHTGPDSVLKIYQCHKGLYFFDKS